MEVLILRLAALMFAVTLCYVSVKYANKDIIIKRQKKKNDDHANEHRS